MPDFVAMLAEVEADIARIDRDEASARMRLAALSVQREEAEATRKMLQDEIKRSGPFTTKPEPPCHP